MCRIFHFSNYSVLSIMNKRFINTEENYYQKVAEQGYAMAQYKLATCYFMGWGVKRDTKMAVKWYEETAAQGNVNAQFFLGCLYIVGLFGVEKDRKKGMEFMKKVAEQNYPTAQKIYDAFQEVELKEEE